MNLKRLTKEVERLNMGKGITFLYSEFGRIERLRGIKQTVIVEEPLIKKAWINMTFDEREEYQKLKKLLGIKEQ